MLMFKGLWEEFSDFFCRMVHAVSEILSCMAFS